MDGACRDLDVDPDVVRQPQPKLVSPDEALTPERATHAGQQSTHRFRRGGWRVFGPQRFDRIEPIHRAVPLEHQKGKQCARLQAAQLAGALPTIEPDGELSAQLESGPCWSR